MTSMFIAAVLLVSCDQPPQPILTQVLAADGDLFLVESGRREALGPGDVVDAGQSIETGADATALLSLAPGMALQLNPSTSVTIERALVVKNGNAMTKAMRLREASLRLLTGSICVSTPQSFTPAELRVLTAAGALESTEWSNFFVAADADQVRVTVALGSVTFQPASGGASETLMQNYYGAWRIRAATALIPARLAVVDEIASSQLQAAVQAQSWGTELMQRLRNSRPVWRSP